MWGDAYSMAIMSTIGPLKLHSQEIKQLWLIKKHLEADVSQSAHVLNSYVTLTSVATNVSNGSRNTKNKWEWPELWTSDRRTHAQTESNVYEPNMH